MRPCTHRAACSDEDFKARQRNVPARTLTREQRAAERSGMESLLRAHADAQLTLYSALPPPAGAEAAAGSGRDVRRVRAEGAFECRTCSRRFPSFQALGGHRTGHTRLQARHALQQHHGPEHAEAGGKQARAHECAVCGLEFPMGQALGGHMRRHRGEAPAPPEARVEQPEMLDLNHPPLEDRGGDQGVECSESEPRLLNLLV